MTGVLLIKCPDSKGVVASVAQVGRSGQRGGYRVLGSQPRASHGAPLWPLAASQTLLRHVPLNVCSQARLALPITRRRGCRSRAFARTPRPPGPAFAAALWLWLQHPGQRPVQRHAGRHVLPGKINWTWEVQGRIGDGEPLPQGSPSAGQPLPQGRGATQGACARVASCLPGPPPRLQPWQAVQSAQQRCAWRPPQRVVFDYSDMLVGPGNTAVLERGIAEVARK